MSVSASPRPLLASHATTRRALVPTTVVPGDAGATLGCVGPSSARGGSPNSDAAFVPRRMVAMSCLAIYTADLLAH